MNVISIKYSDLITSMNKLTYHAMLEMHQKVLFDIETGCFLRNPIILKRVNNLMTIILQLSELMTRSHVSSFAQPSTGESLEELILNFNADFSFLVQVLAGLPEASSLFCQLNFNNIHK
jgi:hypothetical protein